MDLCTQRLLGATLEALAAAALGTPAGPRCGLCIGMASSSLGSGAVRMAEATSPEEPKLEALSRNLPPLWMLTWLPNMAAAQIAIQTGASGPSHTFTSKSSLDVEAHTLALEWVACGAADAVITGVLDGDEARVVIFESVTHVRLRGVHPPDGPRPTR
jgi:3-oxoacyl-[acyl-carrier-protein] synthase II